MGLYAAELMNRVPEQVEYIPSVLFSFRGWFFFLLYLGMMDDIQNSLLKARRNTTMHTFLIYTKDVLAAGCHSPTPHTPHLRIQLDNERERGIGKTSATFVLFLQFFHLGSACGREAVPWLSGFISLWHQGPSRCPLHYQYSSWQWCLNSNSRPMWNSCH